MKPLDARTSDFYRTPTVLQQCCSCFFPRLEAWSGSRGRRRSFVRPSLFNRPGWGGWENASGRVGSKAPLHVNHEREVINLSRPGWSDGPIWCLLSSLAHNCISLEQAPRAMQDRDRPSRIYTHVSGINVSLYIECGNKRSTGHGRIGWHAAEVKFRLVFEMKLAN